ncbi:OmpA family protein [Luteimonas gilva]|uniref:OmpA family protein n=1 Tax=Luteimonas gilva TaxID=2572684 RepID=A0A4U5JXG1_9GAMM|nr:OmpA family protein [Luteimonas gilva]TKR33428.1 OmpA family protein [Luteimonas gilva]
MKRTAYSISIALAAALAAGCTAQQTKPAPAPPLAANQKLSSDSLFAFGKSSLADLSDEGRRELDALAAGLNSRPYEVVHVIGHSDRIGNDKANLDLSTRRAAAVRAYLVQQGVPADKITAVGRGSVEPVVECDDKDRPALIACLAPNRRVEIKIVNP